MASPPFAIVETLPGDADIVSQHPTNARSFRDTVESWLLVNHNVQGHHDEVALDHKADPLAPGAGITEVWASSTGNAAGKLKMRRGASGAVEYVGVPPGVVFYYAGNTIPEGYLAAVGGTASRTTDADLFDAISTTYGIGDGSTTFGLPDIGGRVIAGKETVASRLTVTYFGSAGSTLGATGGGEGVALTSSAQLPSHSHGTSGDSHQNGIHYELSTGFTSAGGTERAVVSIGGGSQFGNSDPAASGLSITATGSSSAHPNVQPTIVLHAIIKR